MTASELLIGLKQFDSPENRVKKLKYMIPPVPRQVAFQTEVQPTHSAPKDNLSKKMPTGFGVQIGVFGNYSYAERAVTDFRFRFDEVLRIYETQLGGKEVFRIIAGKFEQKRKAKDFKEILSMMGVEGMVKDFSKLY